MKTEFIEKLKGVYETTRRERFRTVLDGFQIPRFLQGPTFFAKLNDIWQKRGAIGLGPMGGAAGNYGWSPTHPPVMQFYGSSGARFSALAIKKYELEVETEKMLHAVLNVG